MEPLTGTLHTDGGSAERRKTGVIRSETGLTVRAVLQKLLNANLARVIVERGYDQVGGIVVEARDVTGLRTAGEIAEAFGFRDAPQFLDVVRFELPMCASLTRPVDTVQRNWPTYPSGFLNSSEIVPVWELSRTRFSPGAEYWRIGADGSQQLLSAYLGAARGWKGARGWRPPSALVGTRARWSGEDFTADIAGEEVTLTRFAEVGGDGWNWSRPGVWTRQVPLADCVVFELVCMATLRGIPVRVLASDGQASHLQVTGSPEDAEALGAAMVEPGVFELGDVPMTDLSDQRWVANELSRPDSASTQLCACTQTAVQIVETRRRLVGVSISGRLRRKSDTVTEVAATIAMPELLAWLFG